MAERILIVGSGGREAGIVAKLRELESIKAMYCAPGNDGMRLLDAARVHRVFENGIDDFAALCDFAKTACIDLTIVGPEAPLVAGIVDLFCAQGLRIVGPTRAAAQIEGSKVFCKELLRAHNIRTPDFAVFGDPSEAHRYLSRVPMPIVVKADGLASGKGVIVAHTRPEAYRAIETLMVERKFGDAGRRVVIEKFLRGIECSVMALSDGTSLLPLPPVQDYKRVGDNNTGANTGGMGSIAPSLDDRVDRGKMRQKILKDILYPTISALREAGTPYRGVLYAGLMISQNEPYVLEFNCRFGDPELQALIGLLRGDFLSWLEATIDGKVHALPQLDRQAPWRTDRCAVCLVLATPGYPEKFETGLPIDGLDDLPPRHFVHIIHAGTRWCPERQQWLTNSGRVLNLVAIAPSFREARARVYAAAADITFGGREPQYRRDIGADVSEKVHVSS